MSNPKHESNLRDLLENKVATSQGKDKEFYSKLLNIIACLSHAEQVLTDQCEILQSIAVRYATTTPQAAETSILPPPEQRETDTAAIDPLFSPAVTFVAQPEEAEHAEAQPQALLPGIRVHAPIEPIVQ